MLFDVITLFPGLFEILRGQGVTGRALERGLAGMRLWNPRDYTTDVHRTVDDRPYGGGPGMVMKVAPLFEAVSALRAEAGAGRVILLSPQGATLTQERAKRLAEESHLILICGRYEGVDERVREHVVDEELSIGDYVLTGGELAAMVVVDVVVRMIPGVVGSRDSVRQDSFFSGCLDYPQYTRPAAYRGWEVPRVLLEGNHQLISRWRRRQMLRKTWERRPDLLSRAALDEADRRFVQRLSAREAPPEPGE